MQTGPLFKDIAFKGGGAKGFIDIGVAMEFERLGLNTKIHRVAGTSVGAMFGLFFASGKPAAEVQQLAFSTDFNKIINNHWMITNVYDLICKGGLHDGKDLQQFIKDFVKSITQNENTTYLEWHQFKEQNPHLNIKDFYTEACNISRQINEVFSWENERLRDVPIWQGVAASAAFPFYFEPISISINGQTELFSDGGLQNNCPIDLFENANNSLSPNAIGIWLASSTEIHLLNQDTLPPFTSLSGDFAKWKAQIESQLEGETYHLLDSTTKEKMILCDNLGVGTLEFDMSDDKKQQLVISGIASVFFYLAKHYPEFAAEHYSAAKFNDMGINEQHLAALGFEQNYFQSILSALEKLPQIETQLLEGNFSNIYQPLHALKITESDAQKNHYTLKQELPIQGPLAEPTRPSTCTII